MINLSTGAFFDRSSSQIGGLRTQAESLQQQISTGERLDRSSDDPVAAARLRQLDRSERLAEIDERNSLIAETDLALTDQALTSITDVLARARELAVRASNDTLTDDQRVGIAVEIETLRDSLISLANSRSSAGHALLGGQAEGEAYVDNGTSVSFIGTTDITPIEIGRGQSVIPGVTGPEVFEFETANGQTDLFAVLGNLAAVLAAGGAASADASSAALADLEVGLERVTTTQSVVGSRLNWVDLVSERRESNAEQIAQERADVGGADIALTMSRLQETLTVLEASQASFVRLSNLSLFSLLR
jgi:flagellar hook-associated protein 3 FlgL